MSHTRVSHVAYRMDRVKHMNEPEFTQKCREGLVVGKEKNRFRVSHQRELAGVILRLVPHMNASVRSYM